VAPELSHLTRSFPDDPALDTAVSRALMLRAAAGEAPESLRIALPGSIVAFGRRDVVSPGYADAVRAARDGGFEAIERLAGGRAAVFTDQTISLAHAVPDPDPRPRVFERFEATAGLIAEALEALGVDARVGEVAGEYCPGQHSVNAAGRRKLMGVGQRLVSGGAHLGAVVVVEGAGRINAVLGPVYDALGLDWRPAATGAVADEAPGTTWQDVAGAIRAAYAERYELVPGEIDEETMALARRLAPEHLSPRG
jgi:octanoyl-[GcvH]:protein N-octanoyltransferase